MVKQFRIEHLHGVEVLVCEFYAKHTWNPQEIDAYHKFREDGKFTLIPSPNDFRVALDEWLALEHDPQESFFGLSEPIPVYEYAPHMVIRGAIVNNKVASFSADYAASVSQREVLDGVDLFFEFVRSPHWRNTISLSVPNYGSLFVTDNHSESR